jgi:hypothetical protein
MLSRRPARFFQSLLILFSLFIYAPGALAASLGTLQSLDTPFYDPDSTGAGCASASVDLVGSNNAEQAFTYYIQKGLTPVQAAGILGNFQRESGVEPRRVQGGGLSDTNPLDGKTGYGLAQWTYITRQQALSAFAKSENRPVSALDLQLDFSWKESNDTKVMDTMKTIRTISAATEYWMTNYENPGVPALSERISYAQGILAKYGSGGTDLVSADSTVCDSSSADQTVNNFSLPVAKKWYNQNPDWFTKPHHDYPAADIPVPSGTNVYAAADGKITAAPAGGGCGNGVVEDIGNGITFTYCHGIDGGSVTGAHTGDQVTSGQLIMHSDNTGSSTGPHVHFQIKVNGTLLCPQSFLVGIAKGSVPDITSLPSSGCTN